MPLVRRSDLSPGEIDLLESELGRRRKSSRTLWTLWFFLGLAGVHRFYLGESIGVVYVFLWCLLVAGLPVAALPLFIMLLVDALSNRERLAEVNERLERAIIEEIWSRRRPRAGGRTAGADGAAVSPE